VTPELSRRAGQALGSAIPAPTPDERQTVIDGLAGACSWDEVTPEARRLIEMFEARRAARGR
jgi:NAD(P)H-hydrate repair Nnr-like enzyme with NAD(P)H-hydrate epimerase domain